MEWRGAVFTENEQAPPSNVIVQVRNPQYYVFVNGSWVKQFDVSLNPGSSGAYLAGNPVGTETEEAHLGLKPQVLEMSPLWGSEVNPVGVQFFSYGF
jgi:hypothetical protein